MEETPRKLKKRQKLCHNCEGEIDLDVIVCPFCAADLRKEKPEQGSFTYSGQRFVQDQQTSQSLYPAASPFKQPETEAVAPQAFSQDEESRNVIVPTILFTLGVQLALLGLLMLLFSHQGMVILRWNASWWFLYCLFGLPFLYFGYRSLAKL